MQNEQKKVFLGLLFLLALTLCFTAFIFINTLARTTAYADTAIEKPHFSGGGTSIEKEWDNYGNLTVPVTFPSIRNISYTFDGDGKFSYYSETSGIITANSVGTCTLTFTPNSGFVWADDGTATPVTLTLTVKGTDISEVAEFREIEKCIYDGTEKRPTATIFNNLSNRNMTEGTEFIYSDYSNNINAGEATITITGIGNYSGTLSTTFRIEKADFTPTISCPSTISKDTPLSFDGNVGGGEASWSVEDGTGKAQIDGSTLIPVQAGTVTVILSIAETDNYNPATVTQTVEIIVKSAPDVAITTSTNVKFGENLALTCIVNSGDGKVSWSVGDGTGKAEISGSTLIPTQAGTVTLKLTVAETAEFAALTKTLEITIAKADILPDFTYGELICGTDSATPQVTGNAGNGALTWSVESGTGSAVINVESGILSPTHAGTVTVTLHIAESVNYNAGTAFKTVTINNAHIPESPDDPTNPSDKPSTSSPQSGLSTVALVFIILVAVLSIAFASTAVIIAVRKKNETSDYGGFYDDIDGDLK